MHHYKISIIIPTFNEEKHLTACLKSILDINYHKENIEIIVVDNGSTDRTIQIAKKNEAKVIQNDYMNVSGLRNLGVENSKSEIIAFIDADCIVTKEWLNNAAIYFDDSSVSAWGSPPLIPKNSSWVQKTWFLIRNKDNQVQEVNWLETMNLFVRKKQFIDVQGFNESLITCEDVDFSYRIRKYGKIISDSRIKVIHIGEAATVKEFIKKEMWRGKSNLRGILSHGLLLKEMLSLAIPIYFGIILPIILTITIICFNIIWSITFLLVCCFPSILVFIKLKIKNKKLIEYLRLILLLQIYFLARTIAVVKRL